MKLSKAQVISLFLATTSANDVTQNELIQGNCSEDTVETGISADSLIACSSATTCTTDADCPTSGEKCGTWVEDSVAQADTPSYCVSEANCNSIGLRNTVAWTVMCNNADFQTVAADAIPVAATLVDNYESVIMNDSTGGLAAGWFDMVSNLKVMAADNFLGGYWYRTNQTEINFGIYNLSPHSVNNNCQHSGTGGGCAADECCVEYPDSSRNRCINVAIDGVMQQLPPFANFTPTCIADPSVSDDTPAEGGDITPVEGGDTPAEEADDAPVDGGETPVEGGAETPAEEEETPVESSDTPAEGETPVESDDTPAENSDAPVEGGDTPVEESEETPVEEGETPTEGDETPVDSDTPVEGDDTPVESDEAPVEEDNDTPVEGDLTPVENDETPTEGGNETPAEGEETPIEGDDEEIDEDGPPISAAEDLADEALANAASELDQFTSLIVNTFKEQVGYEDMTDEEQTAFDQQLADSMAEDEIKAASDKVLAGYDGLSTAQKVLYESEYLDWVKETWEVCELNINAIECKHEWEIRNTIETAKANVHYYKMNDDERAAFDETIPMVTLAVTTGLVEKASEEWQPAIGAPGQKCSAFITCTGAGHCCGTATPSLDSEAKGAKQLEGRCAPEVTGSLLNDDLKLRYSHVCGAKALMATATAILAFASLL